VIALLAVALATLPPSVQPWPIGVGPRYRPAPAPPPVRAARPVGREHCHPDSSRFRIHLALFANRRVIPIPAGIGVAAPFRREGADVRPGGCVYALNTTAPTGVVRVARRGTTVGDLFRIWGQRLAPRHLLSFRGRVHAYVGGAERAGDPRSIRLTPHAQIVLEIGGYLPPHPSYLFPKGAP
jgi:hypothetical protein